MVGAMTHHVMIGQQDRTHRLAALTLQAHCGGIRPTQHAAHGPPPPPRASLVVPAVAVASPAMLAACPLPPSLGCEVLLVALAAGWQRSRQRGLGAAIHHPAAAQAAQSLWGGGLLLPYFFAASACCLIAAACGPRCCCLRRSCDRPFWQRLPEFSSACGAAGRLSDIFLSRGQGAGGEQSRRRAWAGTPTRPPAARPRPPPARNRCVCVAP